MPCISSVTYDCISSTLVVVYHHAVACMRCPSQEIPRYALNDRTTLEMTVFLLCRHFDQVKRVEKSPKAEQYLPTILLSPCLLQSIFSLLTLTYPYFPKALSNSAIQPSIFSPPPNSLFSLFFILFLFIYRCYNMLYLIILLFFVLFFRTTR